MMIYEDDFHDSAHFNKLWRLQEYAKELFPNNYGIIVLHGGKVSWVGVYYYLIPHVIKKLKSMYKKDNYRFAKPIVWYGTNKD